MQNNTANLPESFGTVSQTLTGLRNLGYVFDFNIKEKCLVCNQTQLTLTPEHFCIDKVYRFEGESNPDDESIVYAISSPKYGVKGTLVNGYGISADEALAALVAKLHTHKHADFRTADSTPQRPEGERLLEAPQVVMDTADSIRKLREEEAWQSGDRNSITLFKSDSMRIVLIGLHAHAKLKPHKAKGIISVQVLEGHMEFSTADSHTVLQKGQLLALSENIMHSVKAVEDTFFLLTLALK